ncbi:MAG: hypothetical protein V4488_26235 [Pseudomonadota bacterium]
MSVSNMSDAELKLQQIRACEEQIASQPLDGHAVEQLQTLQTAITILEQRRIEEEEYQRTHPIERRVKLGLKILLCALFFAFLYSELVYDYDLIKPYLAW